MQFMETYYPMRGLPAHIAEYTLISNGDEGNPAVLALEQTILDRLHLPQDEWLSIEAAEEHGLSAGLEFGVNAIHFLINLKKVDLALFEAQLRNICAEAGIPLQNPINPLPCRDAHFYKGWYDLPQEPVDPVHGIYTMTKSSRETNTEFSTLTMLCAFALLENFPAVLNYHPAAGCEAVAEEELLRLIKEGRIPYTFEDGGTPISKR